MSIPAATRRSRTQRTTTPPRRTSGSSDRRGARGCTGPSGHEGAPRPPWFASARGREHSAPMREERTESPEVLLERYRILSEMASDYTFKTRIEEDGSIMLEWISDSWARDFGYRPADSQDLFEHVHPDDRRRAAAQWEELLKGRPVDGEVRLLPRAGGELWVH